MNTYVVKFLKCEVENVNTLTETEANRILNEISEIIWDDNLSDSEALEKIIIKLNKYTVTTEGGIGEQKQN